MLLYGPLQAVQKFSRYIEITPHLANPVLSEDGKNSIFMALQLKKIMK
jgi:hypothetical protein